MKTIYFLVFLLNTTFLLAQNVTYQPMHGTTSLWLMNSGYFDGFGPVETQLRTITSGDTLINTKLYTRIFRGPINPNAPMNYIGGFRDDDLTETRYFIDVLGNETAITISPYLTVGDTFTDINRLKLLFNINASGDFFNYFDTCYVQEIDSVLEDNGNYSFTYTFGLVENGNWSSGYPNVIFNGKQGLITYNGFESWIQTYCYREDDEILDFGGINPPWAYSCLASVEEDEFIVQISPNPSNYDFEFNALEIIRKIEIFDLGGKKIQSFSPNSTQTTLNFNETGVFQCRVEGESGNVACYKLIKL